MQLKIVQLNVWDEGHFLDEIVSFLRKESPDIIICQEVYDSHDQSLPARFRTLQELTKALGVPYFVYSPCMNKILPEGKIPWGNAIFSKHPISSSNTYFYYRGLVDMRSEEPKDFLELPRNLQHAQIRIDNKTVNVFNNHGFWDFKGDNTDRRLMMADFIIDKTKGKENVILTGDFNVHEDTESIRKIEQNLTNVFKGERKTSFNMKQKTDPGFATAVVDFIFVSGNIRIIEHKQPEVNISDHFPLVATLVIAS